MKKEFQIDYINKRKGNVAKLIEKFYDDGNVIGDDMLSLIDFSETIKKIININNSTYHIEETVAENIVATLEPKKYVNYINSNWLEKDKISEANLITSLMYENKYDIVKVFLDKIYIEAIKENNFNGKINKLFKKDCLGIILNLEKKIENYIYNPNNININEYYNLFVYGLDKYNDYLNSVKIEDNYIRKALIKEKESFINLLQEQKYILSINSFNYLQKESFIKNIIKTDKLYNFFTLIQSYEENKKESVFNQKENLRDIIDGKNLKVINFFIKNEIFTKKEIEEEMIKNIQLKLKKIEEDYESNHSLLNIEKKINETIKFYEKCSNLHGILKDITLYSDNDKLFFLLGSENEFSKLILDKDNLFIKKEIKIKSLINPMTISAIAKVDKLFEEISKNENLYFLNSYAKEKNEDFLNKKSKEVVISLLDLYSILLNKNNLNIFNNLNENDLLKLEEGVKEDLNNFLYKSCIESENKKVNVAIEYYINKTMLDNNEIILKEKNKMKI